MIPPNLLELGYNPERKVSAGDLLMPTHNPYVETPLPKVVVSGGDWDFRK